MKAFLLKLIAEGKLKAALDELQKVEDTQDRYFKRDLTLFSARFHRNQQENHAGILSPERYGIERNQIENGVIAFLDSNLDENAVFANFKPHQPAKPNIVSPKTDKINILMLTALPAGTTEVDLNKEMARISEKLQEKKTLFEFVVKRSVNRNNFKELTETHQPTILHFSGHGTDGGAQGGLVLHNEEKNGYELVSPQKLEVLFQYFKRTFQIQTVLLNACLSKEQAQVIAKHVPYVVGTTVEMENEYCVAFSVGFYFSLATSGHDYEQAFYSGRTEAALNGANETDFVFYKEGQICDI